MVLETSIYSDGATTLLRRDSLDKKSEEATFVSTDSIRMTGSVKFEVFAKMLSHWSEKLPDRDFGIGVCKRTEYFIVSGEARNYSQERRNLKRDKGLQKNLDNHSRSQSRVCKKVGR